MRNRKTEQLIEQVVEQIAAMSQAHATPRRTLLMESSAAPVAAAVPLEVDDEPCVVLLSSTGLLARTPDASAAAAPAMDQRSTHDVVVSAAPAPVFDPTVTAPFAVHSYEIRLKPPVGWMAIPPAVVSHVMRSDRGNAGPTLTALSRTASMTVVGSERA